MLLLLERRIMIIGIAGLKCPDAKTLIAIKGDTTLEAIPSYHTLYIGLVRGSDDY